MDKGSLSLVIPTYNEAGNLKLLVERIDQVLSHADINYQLIVIDDNSDDDTFSIALTLSNVYPLEVHTKLGPQGKAFSLIEGFDYAKYPFIGFIDADLQYPPEALPYMVQLLDKFDVVVADRQSHQEGYFRELLSRGFREVFAKFLHNLDYDVQSGMKLFKREVINRLKLDPSPWTFDLEFLLKASYAGYIIGSYGIEFHKRYSGNSKINTLKASWEIGKSAVISKFKPIEVIPFLTVESEPATGFHYKGRRYDHFTKLDHLESAIYSLTSSQKIVLMFALLSLFIGLIINWHTTIILLLAIIVILYFIDLVYYFYLIYASFSHSKELKISDNAAKKIPEDKLPKYTIFCPLYQEWRVLPQFVTAMKRLNYPADKLQVLLLLEANDKETLEKANKFDLPNNFKIIVVPHTMPKTKPKACNYGLRFATGEYAVIYDAEDIPDPLQLRKVFLTFANSTSDVSCVQAKLNFYNPNQNLLTRLFTAEYSLWFELILTGLQTLNAPIPLGGTSNHFRLKDLIALHGWDSFNVTEDCDLGVRLSLNGFRTVIIDSSTMEEANSDWANWYHQRTRWIKGYIQTYLVRMRNVKSFIKKSGWINFIHFQLVVGGKILAILVNPFMWLLSFGYFLMRSQYGEFIESLFPSGIFYFGVTSMVIGNFLYFYYYMIGLAKRNQFGLIKYAFIIPFYWLAMSIAGWGALYLLIKEPHFWSKTKHGLHLTEDKPVIPRLNLGQKLLGWLWDPNPIKS